MMGSETAFNIEMAWSVSRLYIRNILATSLFEHNEIVQKYMKW